MLDEHLGGALPLPPVLRLLTSHPLHIRQINLLILHVLGGGTLTEVTDSVGRRLHFGECCAWCSPSILDVST